MAMKLDIQLFSGAGTDTARRQAQAISDKYAEMVSKIKSAWNKIDEWGVTYASGATFITNMKTTAEGIQNIPEPKPAGSNVNAYLREITDIMIRNANREDQINNKGQAQVTNPFVEQHYTCAVNTPPTRSYHGIEDFKGITDEGVADINRVKRYIDELSDAIQEIFSTVSSFDTTGTSVTGRNLTGEFSANISNNAETLTSSLYEFAAVVDGIIQSQEDASASTSNAQTF